MNYKVFRERILRDYSENESILESFHVNELYPIVVEIDRKLEHLEELMRLNGDKG